MASTYHPDYTKWKMNHSMIRIKDPKKTIDFYSQLGLKVISKVEQSEAKFDLYFLAYDYPSTSEYGGAERSDREGLLELTHNYGTENDDSYKANTGNDGENEGFSHIGIAVDNIQAACKRLDGMGVTWQEKLEDGFPHRAFARDPDGYLVEIVTENYKESVGKTDTNPETYRFNHTALRVKDPKVSVKWYEDMLGMKLMRSIEREGMSLYFVGYPGKRGVPSIENKESNPLAQREGLVELMHYHGTEKKEGQVYHNGNKEPQGFGHLCVSVDDLNGACEHFETLKVNWKKRLTDGRMRHIAFIMDPDEYWVEVIGNQTLKK